MLYFAYCTYLDGELIRHDYPGATYVKRAILHDYELTFVATSHEARIGTCHLEAALGQQTRGVLWEIPARELLAEVEGYERRAFVVTSEDGARYDAWTLVARNPLHRLKPSASYFATVLKGARNSGLPGSYIKRLEELYESEVR